MQKLGTFIYIIISCSIILAALAAINIHGWSKERGVIIFSSIGGLIMAISLLKKE